MKFKILIISMIFFTQFSFSQKIELFGTFGATITKSCDGASSQEVSYVTFYDEYDEVGYVAYNKTKSGIYYSTYLGNFSIVKNNLKIEITQQSKGNPLVKIVNGIPETYTVTHNYNISKEDDRTFILSNSTECAEFIIKLKKLNNIELEEFKSKLE